MFGWAQLIVMGCLSSGVQDVDNPEYQDWKAFKPGAWVRFKHTTNSDGAKREWESVHRLLDLSPIRVILHQRLAMGASPVEKRAEVLARRPKGEVWQTVATKSTEGMEELDVSGRKLACAWTEWKRDGDLVRIWASPLVPGQVVKVVQRPSAPPGPASTMVAIEWKLEDALPPYPPLSLPDTVELPASLEVAAAHFHASGRRAWFDLREGGVSHLWLDGQKGPPFHSLGGPRFSVDGKRLAYVGSTYAAGKTSSVLLLDGIPQSGGPPGGPACFSPDGIHFAYTAQREGGVTVVVDQAPGPLFSRVEMLSFSTDNRPVYVAQTIPGESPQRSLLVIGNHSIPMRSAGYPAVSEDGNHVAWCERTPFGKTLVHIDDKVSEPFDDVKSLLWSADGQTLAIVARIEAGGMIHVVRDGKRSEGFTGIDDLVFSLDGKRLAYTGLESGSPTYSRVVLDGKKGERLRYHPRGPYLNPDGSHLAYVISEGNGFTLILDGKRQTSFREIGRPVFSPEGRHIAYSAAREQKDRNSSATKRRYFVVLDGSPGGEFDFVSDPAFSPDGKEVGYFALEVRTLSWKTLSVR